MKFARIKHFLHVGIWREDENGKENVSLLTRCLRTLYLAVRFFIDRGHSDYAPALSFSTMLAIVPVAAVIFAIARGFGLSVHIEQWFREALSSQPQAAEAIIEFANSYLVHARSGVILGLGLVFMLYSVLSLLYNVEHVFDDIWQVKKRRSPLRIITDYTAMLFLVPIVIILISSMNIFVYAIADRLQAFALLGPMVKLLIRLMPWVLMSAAFTALYVAMPNTKVHLTKAIVPGIIAGTAMLLLQYFYIKGQMFLTGYNAIYGSFAALPLFMLWMQLSWYICLFCAELCYTNQNMEYYAFLIRTEDVSHNRQMEMCIMLLSLICKRFAEGKKPYTALELKQQTGIPIRITTDLLYRLRQVGLISENGDSENYTESTYQPAQDIANITVGRMEELLGSYPNGSHKYLNAHAEKVISKEGLAQVATIRNCYLKELKRLPLRDL
ncbi:MAG: YihY/virulence factor BrkB family protein [Prevotella sp.]|nr:YihY/virulence factor BrkB family protein [Prevotella sp.]